MKKDDAIEILANTYELRSDYYEMYYKYFDKEKDLDNLTIDEKVEISGYLIDMDVYLHNGKFHGYGGKREKLFNYFCDNVDQASDETLDKVEKHASKQKERRREAQELEIKEKYPEVYKELMDLRKENFLYKKKILVKEQK